MDTTSHQGHQALSPVQALRCIRAILQDRTPAGIDADGTPIKPTHAMRAVVIELVTRAGNKTGLAHSGYRSLREATGACHDVIRDALAWGVARGHLVDAGLNRQGATVFRVIPAKPTRSGKRSAPENRALRETGPSAPETGEAGAPETGDKLTSLLTSPKKLTHTPARASEPDPASPPEPEPVCVVDSLEGGKEAAEAAEAHEPAALALVDQVDAARREGLGCGLSPRDRGQIRRANPTREQLERLADSGTWKAIQAWGLAKHPDHPASFFTALYFLEAHPHGAAPRETARPTAAEILARRHWDGLDAQEKTRWLRIHRYETDAMRAAWEGGLQASRGALSA